MKLNPDSLIIQTFTTTPEMSFTQMMESGCDAGSCSDYSGNAYCGDEQ